MSASHSATSHGTINLWEDVERLVADPCFLGGPIEEVLIAIGDKHHIPLDWHPGFTIPVAKVPDYFRGFAVKPLAYRIAGQGILDAAKIGTVANSVQLEPESWEDWGPYDDILGGWE